MKHLSALDYAVVSGYLLLIASLGSSFYRRRSTPKEYFLGGRSMSWLPVGISIIAADLSAITVMGTPAWTFRHNLELLWSSFGYPLMAPVVILVFVPFYSKLNLYTAYEYLERRFNLPVRLLTSLLFLALRSVHVALVIYAPALVIHLVTGLPGWQCILAMGLFTTVYTTLGGMKAVIWTDVIQFFTVTLGVGLIFYTALSSVKGGVAVAYNAALEAGRLKFLNLSTDPGELTSLWACLLGGSVLCMAPLTTDQAILQRMFTTRSVRDCRQSILLQSAIVIPVALLLYSSGAALYAFYHFRPERLAGLVNDDALLPLFAMRELPAGVSGLIIAAIFAASMAVMSAGINSLTTASTVDFYQRVFRPAETGEHCAKFGRWGTVVWGSLVTFLALFAGRLGALALAYNRVSSVISGPLLGIFLLATLTRRTTASGALAGALAGIAAIWLVSASTNWSFFWFGPVGVVATVVVGYASSFLTAPPRQEKIVGLVKGCETAQ